MICKCLFELGKDAVPELVKLLDLKDHITARGYALKALRWMGPAGAKATDAVRKLANDPNEPLMEAAQETLKSLTGH